ncbi:MAG: GTPase Era [Burkholderiales bacterium]
MTKSPAETYRAGQVTIVGRPNVGKSTLLNRLIGTKVSITSSRPQTTRHRILGVVTHEDAQLVFLDTPGYQIAQGGALNKLMNRAVTESLDATDAVLWLVEALQFGAEDKQVLQLLPKTTPVILAINKIDKIADKSRLLPFIERVSQAFRFSEVMPISASKGTQLPKLLEVLKSHLPVSPPAFDSDALTDRSERFLASEFLREKLFRRLGEELPYATAVSVESFELKGEVRHIHATIVVSKASHKAIVIGKNGEKLKTIATEARIDMEKLFGGKVFLDVWVRVRSGWMDSARDLKSLGYH